MWWTWRVGLRVDRNEERIGLYFALKPSGPGRKRRGPELQRKSTRCAEDN
jgi:hypothetical protein